jgi:hypothetical protein
MNAPIVTPSAAPKAIIIPALIERCKVATVSSSKTACFTASFSNNGILTT